MSCGPGQCFALLDESGLNRKQQRSLATVLRKVIEEFDQGDFEKARQRLRVFLSKLRAVPSKDLPGENQEAFIRCVRNLMEMMPMDR